MCTVTDRETRVPAGESERDSYRQCGNTDENHSHITAFATEAAGMVGGLVHISALCSLSFDATKGKVPTGE